MKRGHFAYNFKFTNSHANLLLSLANEMSMMCTTNIELFHRFTKSTWNCDSDASCHIINKLPDLWCYQHQWIIARYLGQNEDNKKRKFHLKLLKCVSWRILWSSNNGTNASVVHYTIDACVIYSLLQTSY